jgi:uncharacterized protein YjiS (DUF1127 family)
MNRITKTIAADIVNATTLPSPAAALRQMLKAVDDWMSRSRQRRALAQLDAHLLRDIGVTAYDAAHEAAKPFWK